MRERWLQRRSDLCQRAEGVLLKLETFEWLRAMYVSTKRTSLGIVGCRRHRRWWELGVMVRGLLQGNLDSRVLFDVEKLRGPHHEVVVCMHLGGFLGVKRKYELKPPGGCLWRTSYALQRMVWLLDADEALAREVLLQLKHVGVDGGE